MIKKGAALLMALALCLTLLPASALAAEAQGQAGQEQTALTQGNDGQTQAPGQNGTGEGDKTSDEVPDEAPDEEPDKAPDKAPDEEPDEAVSAVQALIDALPAAEDISDANADEVSGQLDAIDEAKQALTEKQAARLDLTGYDAAAAAVLALAGEPDANEPALLAAIDGTQPGGSGTAEDPYRITGAAELIWLRDAVNAGETSTCAELRQDVEYVDEVWTSIGTSEHPYTGTFNGNGHTIRVWLNGWGQALFGYVGADAKLTDLAVTKRQSENYSIIASAPLARINNGTITRCRYSGGITAKDSLGGLVYTNSGTIEACCVYAGRLNRGSRIEMYYGGLAGGIAYENTGTIANSYFYGDMVQAQSNGTVSDIIGWGAIAHKNSGMVSNCYYGADRDDGYGGKTEDQFRGGEVAYLLNGGTARDDWRQNCYAGDNSDATPVLDRSHAQIRKSGSSYVSLYPHVHCICGGDATSGGHPQHSDVSYTAWTNDEAASQYGDSSHTAANSLPKDPGYYYLTTSVTLSDSDTWRPADGTVLCLNGRTVREFAYNKPDFDAITVDSGVTFSLTECASIQGYIYCAGSRGTHTVNNSGTFNMYNGRLRGTTSTADGAAVYNYGTLNLSGTVNATKNVFLGTGRTITVVGELDDATSIPIQTAATPEAGSPVTIATTENADWIKEGSFVSWTPGKYAVSRINEGKTVVLRGHEHDWSYTLGSDGTAIRAECGNADGLCGNPNGGSVTIAPPSGGLIYDGSAKAARLTKTGWTAADVGEITYQKDGSALSAAPVDAGTYTAGITVGGQTASVTYTIRQAVPQAGDFAFSPPDTLTYDGSARTAAVAARAGVAGMGGVTVKYYRNGVKVEQPADVGTYNVRIDVAEGKNYDAAADLTDDSWTFTIAANETAPAVTLSGDTTYTGGQIRPVPTVKIGSTKLTEGRDYTVAYGENRDVSTGGTVTITAMGNYAFSAVAESFAITPRAVTVSGITAADKTYNGSADAVLDVSGAVISGKAEGDELTVSADGTFDSKDVGTDRTVRISGLTLGGASAGNYRLAASGQQASAMAAITPAVITVTPDAGQGKIYGADDPALTYISAGAVNGETPAFSGGLVRDAGANAGSYAITGGTLALADGSGFKADNYTLKLADEVVYFTIHRAAYGDRTVNGSAMYDNNGTVDLSSLIAEGGTAVLGSVTDDAGVLAGTCSVSEGILRFGFADDASKVGRTAKVKVNVTGADNYEDYTITVILTVEAKLTPSPEGALTLSPAEITYGEKLGAIAISGTMQADGRTVAGTFTWQEPDTVLDAGTHAGAAWKFTPDDTKTYVEATGTVAVQVNRAAQSAAVSMADYTYNDAPSMPSLTYKVGDGSAVYYYGTENAASGGTEWENMQPTTLDAGTYYMYAVIGETDNYKEFTTAAVQFVVKKAAPDYTKPSGLTAKYGQRLGDIQLVNPEGNLAGTWSWQAPETVLEQLGTQSFDADFRPDSDNYKGVVDAAIDVTVGPADGRNLKTVELVQKYTDTEEHTYAPDWSALPKGQQWTFDSEASEVLPRQDFAADGSLLTYAIPEGKALGDQITITLKASCANYEDFTITLHILLREKDDQAALRVTGGTTVVYGEKLQLGSSGGSGTGKVAYAVTNGTGEAVIDPDTGVLTPVKVGIVTVSVTKAEDKDYKEAVSDAVIVTITKARPTGQPNYTKIITRGKTLDDAALTLADSTISPADGVLEWVDDAGNVLPGSTRVKANTAYKWRFTPADGNYTTLSGEIELYYKPNGGNQYGTDHTIRASAGVNGTISPVGWTSVGEGGEQTFTITPDAGYAVAKVLVDGRSVGAVTSYTFRNVTQDHTIEAVFMKANGNPQTGVTVTRNTIGCGR